MVEIGTYKIPEIQNQHAKIKNELEAIDYKKTMAKYELQNIDNQIAILNRDIHNKRNEIVYLHFGAQELEGHLRGLKNHGQQQPIS
jgi:predicted  nucleic acid-binding Zn-ribbon protein